MRFIQNVDKRDYIVTGVIRDITSNSHLKFKMLGSLVSLIDVMPGRMQTWRFSAYHSYVTLEHDANLSEINKKLKEFIKTRYDEENARITEIELQPIKEIHFRNDILFEPSPTGNITYVYILTLVGFSVIFISIINYMNLATARSAIRSKEVGIKKVLGAKRIELSRQFLGESIITSLISFVCSLFLIEFLLPFLMKYQGKNYPSAISIIFTLFLF